MPNNGTTEKKLAQKRLLNRNISFTLNGKKLMKKRKVLNGKPIKNAVRLTLAKKKRKEKKRKTKKNKSKK